MEYWEVLLLGEEECEDAHMFNKYTLVAVNAGGERKKAEVSHGPGARQGSGAQWLCGAGLLGLTYTPGPGRRQGE